MCAICCSTGKAVDALSAGSGIFFAVASAFSVLFSAVWSLTIIAANAFTSALFDFWAAS